MKKTINLRITMIISLVLLSQSLCAQVRKFQLIDYEKHPLAFMDITVNGKFTDLFTDEKGYFTIDLDAYADTDIVGMFTSFFDTDIARVEVLKKQKKNVLRIANKTITINPVVVSAEVRDPVKLAGLIAHIFTERYGRQDYFANSCCVKTVQSHGTYREFSAAMGVAFFAKYSTELVKFPWDDPALYFWGFYNRMQSDLFQCGSNDILEIATVHGNNANFNVQYDSNFMNMKPIDALRSVELYSPMNAKALSFFNYSLDSVFVRGEDQIVVLGFKSNPSFFPKKSRLLGEGRVVFNSTLQMVEQIELFNFKQYFTTFVRDLTDQPSRHRMHFRLSFHNTEGRMYLKELYLKRIWDKEPPLETGNRAKTYYHNSAPSRRNPVRNGLEEVFYVVYDHADNWMNRGSGDSQTGNKFSPNVVNWLYEVPYTPELWKSCKTLQMFPMSKIAADLGVAEPLDRQFLRHSREPYPESLYRANYKEYESFSSGFSKQFPTYESLTEQCKNNLKYLLQTVLPVLNIRIIE